MPYALTTTLSQTDVLSQDKINNYILSPLADLITPPQAYYQKPSTDPNITSTSTTFAYLDNTLGNFWLNIVTKGNPLEVNFRGILSHSAAGNAIFMEIEIDGVAYGGSVAGIGDTISPSAGASMIFVIHEIIPISAGSHDVKLLWRAGAAGTITLASSVKPTFFIREI